jgi:hypothetical protein
MRKLVLVLLLACHSSLLGVESRKSNKALPAAAQGNTAFWQKWRQCLTSNYCRGVGSGFKDACVMQCISPLCYEQVFVTQSYEVQILPFHSIPTSSFHVNWFSGPFFILFHNTKLNTPCFPEHTKHTVEEFISFFPFHC